MSNSKLRDQIIRDLYTPRGDATKVGMESSLHEGQIPIVRDVFDDNMDIVFAPCGRKFGKSFTAGHCAWRFALFNPNSAIYIVCPEISQAKKIYWDKFIIQRFLKGDTEKYIAGKPNNRELMVRFKNGSFIQLIGSENWAAANGLTPDLVIYDEFKVFHSQFHIEMNPNRAAKGAKLLIIGTQPKVGDRNKEQYEAIMKYVKENPDHCSLHIKTTWDNPINNLPNQKRAIERQIAELRARGDEATVQREYYSRIVAGGSNAIFPMFIKEKFVKSKASLKDFVSQNENVLEFYITIDPANTDAYAGLLSAIHPRTKKVYILDEVYETKQENTVDSVVIPKILAKMQYWAPNVPPEDWVQTCDQAAKWAILNIADRYPMLSFMPTDKKPNDKIDGNNLIKDIFVHNLIEISDGCEWWIWEIENASLNDRGIIPKGNDHLWDCSRYMLKAAMYSMEEAFEAQRATYDTDEIRANRFRSATFDDQYSDAYDEWSVGDDFWD